MESCYLWPFESGFFHWALRFQGSSRLWHVSELHSFSWLNGAIITENSGCGPKRSMMCYPRVCLFGRGIIHFERRQIQKQLWKLSGDYCFIRDTYTYKGNLPLCVRKRRGILSAKRAMISICIKTRPLFSALFLVTSPHWFPHHISTTPHPATSTSFVFSWKWYLESPSDCK